MSRALRLGGHHWRDQCNEDRGRQEDLHITHPQVGSLVVLAPALRVFARRNAVDMDTPRGQHEEVSANTCFTAPISRIGGPVQL